MRMKVKMNCMSRLKEAVKDEGSRVQDKLHDIMEKLRNIAGVDTISMKKGNINSVAHT